MTLAAPFAGVLSSYGIVAARLLLAAVFLYSGQDKLRHWPASLREVAALGIGAAVGAALLAGFTIVATLLGHRFWLLHGSEARRELTTSLEHLAIVGGLVLVGVGALSPG